MAHIRQVGPLLVMVAVLGVACSSDQSRPAGEGAGPTDSAAAAAAARSTGPRRVSSVMIGRRVGAHDRITDPTFQFTPLDTVHVSVGLEGATGPDSMTAAWRSQNGDIVQQSSERIRAGDNTAFHLSQPKGLKPGTYKVVVFLGGDSVDTKVFVVQK